jgi:hypothetical protein
VTFARHGALSSAVRLSIRRHRSGSRSRHGSQVRRIHRGQRVPRLWQVFGMWRWELVGIEAAYLAQRERMNPRFLPTSSRWFLSVQACQAGGRGFESRRSRRKHPAYRHLLLPVLAQSTAGSPTGHALIPARESGRGPVSVKPCKSRCSVAGHGVRVLGHPAAIPQANRPAVLGGAGWDYEWPEASASLDRA